MLKDKTQVYHEAMHFILNNSSIHCVFEHISKPFKPKKLNGCDSAEPELVRIYSNGKPQRKIWNDIPHVVVDNSKTAGLMIDFGLAEDTHSKEIVIKTISMASTFNSYELCTWLPMVQYVSKQHNRILREYFGHREPKTIVNQKLYEEIYTIASRLTFEALEKRRAGTLYNINFQDAIETFMYDGPVDKRGIHCTRFSEIDNMEQIDISAPFQHVDDKVYGNIVTIDDGNMVKTIMVDNRTEIPQPAPYEKLALDVMSNALLNLFQEGASKVMHALNNVGHETFAQRFAELLDAAKVNSDDKRYLTLSFDIEGHYVFSFNKFQITESDYEKTFEFIYEPQLTEKEN